MNRKAFTLIELLVVVAIIGISHLLKHYFLNSYSFLGLKLKMLLVDFWSRTVLLFYITSNS